MNRYFYIYCMIRFDILYSMMIKDNCTAEETFSGMFGDYIENGYKYEKKLKEYDKKLKNLVINTLEIKKIKV